MGLQPATFRSRFALSYATAPSFGLAPLEFGFRGVELLAQPKYGPALAFWAACHEPGVAVPAGTAIPLVAPVAYAPG